VLITGCGRARGIGRGIALAFAEAGADVVATDVAQRRRQPPRVDDGAASRRSLARARARPPPFARVPTGRVARPDDIARLAGFLASDQSDHITGQAWNVDGGLVMH